MWAVSLLAGIALVGAIATHAAPVDARPQAGPAAQQFAGIGPDANCPTGLSAVPPDGGPRACYAPNLQAALYVDATCPSGFITYLVTRGVRVCYTPDEVNQNSNLQGRCAADPSLYICPDDED